MGKEKNGNGEEYCIEKWGRKHQKKGKILYSEMGKKTLEKGKNIVKQGRKIRNGEEYCKMREEEYCKVGKKNQKWGRIL